MRRVNKVVFTTCKHYAFVLLACLYASVSLAQSDVSESLSSTNSSFVKLYEDYQNSGYAVRWSDSANNFALARDKIDRYQYLVLYSSEQLLNDSTQPVVQLGFFKTKKEAQEFVAGNQQIFPGLKVVSVSASEHQALFSGSDGTDAAGAVAAGADAAEAEQNSAYFWLRPNTEQGLNSLQSLMKKAKSLYVDKQYMQALKYYAVLSLTQNDNVALMATELMGVCYERLGLLSLAVHTYAELLAAHPKSNMSGRVTQRLRALETSDKNEKDSLRKAKLDLNSDKVYWRGAIGQSYSQMSQSGTDIEERDVINNLISHFDLHVGRNFNGQKLEMRLDGYDIHDMLDDGDRSKSVIKRFYLNYENKAKGLNIIGGRQQDYDSGVYNSFDGGSLRYALNDHWTVGASAGVPAYFSDFADYIDRKFFSAHVAYDSGAHWTASSYVIQQTFYGETERSAVGAKLSYMSDALYTSINSDYDFEFQELNVLRWIGTYRFSKKSDMTASYGYQRTPFLTASNIQVGQPYLNVEAYVKSATFDYQTLLEEAFARTSLYQYGTLSYNYRVDQDLQFVTDVYYSLSSDMPRFFTDDGWVTSSVERNNQYYEYATAGIQAIVNNLFGNQDTAILGFRHSDTTLSSANWIQVSERFRLGSKVFVKPKVMLKNVKQKSADSGENKVLASLSLTYKPVRSAEIRAEFGSQTDENLDEKRSIESTYFILGYQARF